MRDNGPVSDAFVRDLRALAAAGVPIVCVVTHEESRARALVSQAFEGMRAIEWTATRGWNDDDATRSPLAAIEQATETGDAGICHIMLDLHAWLADARVVRALRDWARTARRVPLVLIMPAASLPADLDRDARILPLPLPDAATLAAALDAEGAPAPDVCGSMVRAAVGLTLDEARRAFRLARSEADPGEAVARVIREKRGALRRNACLDLIDSDVTLDIVGGLDVLKGWLRSRVLAFDARARAFGLAEPRGMLVTGVQGCGKSLVS